MTQTKKKYASPMLKIIGEGEIEEKVARVRPWLEANLVAKADLLDFASHYCVLCEVWIDIAERGIDRARDAEKALIASHESFAKLEKVTSQSLVTLQDLNSIAAGSEPSNQLMPAAFIARDFENRFSQKFFRELKKTESQKASARASKPRKGLTPELVAKQFAARKDQSVTKIVEALANLYEVDKTTVYRQLRVAKGKGLMA